MRIKTLFGATLALISVHSYSQKSKVLAAYNYELAYTQSMDCSELGKAVDAIELALTDEATAVWAKTWFYRGNIYYNVYISQDDACHSLSADALDQAYESYQNALKYDEKSRYKDDIEPKMSVLANLYLQRGAEYFNVKQYNKALVDFERAVEVSKQFEKTDTTALYNAALTAEKVNNPSKAAFYYEMLIDMGHKEPKIYHFLSEANFELGDTTKALQAIMSGRQMFPRSQDLIIDELNYYLKSGETERALKNVEEALIQMPDNAQLHFARGTLLDNLDDFNGSEEAYKKAVELKPDYFDANYNLAQTAEVAFVDHAATLGENQANEFKEAEKNSRIYFNKSLPYLEKANELDPYDRATMVSLKNLYSRMGDEEGYKRISEILDN